MSENATVERGAAGLGQRYPLVPISLAIVLYATGPIFVQSSPLPGTVFAFYRLWLGVLVLGTLTVAYCSRRGWPDRRGWGFAIRAGVAFAVHQLMFMTAIKATSVVDVALVGATSPIVTGVLAIPLFGERPGARFRLWSLLAIAGAGVVALGAAGGPEGDPVGVALAFGNVVAFAVFFLVSKSSRDAISTLPFLFGTIAVAAVGVSLFDVVTAQPLDQVTVRDLWLALAVAVGAGTLGHFLMTWPLRWVPANVPPLLRLATPALAGGMAYVFLDEPIGWFHLAGGVLTVAGVAGAVLSPAGRALFGAPGPGSPVD